MTQKVSDKESEELRESLLSNCKESTLEFRNLNYVLKKQGKKPERK